MKTTQEDPHRLRRKQILAMYPQIQTLFGYEPKTKYFILTILLLQFFVVDISLKLSGWYWLLWMYFAGATLNHMLFILMHELSHQVVFKKSSANRFAALFVNLPIIVPMAFGFEKYHLLHHEYFGHEKKDGDIPTLFEQKWFDGAWGKWVWLLLQPLTYALRPWIKHRLPWSHWETFNVVLQGFWVAGLIRWVDPSIVTFLAGATFMAMSIHPLATHFIAEHYVISGEQETYSYYGPLNCLAFNFGHHVEHHDFPAIPWTRLPKIRQLAPEFYNSLVVHPSWIRFTFAFIFSSRLGLRSRWVR